MNRREFLQRTLTVGAGLYCAHPVGLFQSLASASELISSKQKIKNFVLIRPGKDAGLDTTLGLDPWTQTTRPSESDLFLEYRNDEVIKAQELYLGPSAAPLKNWAENLTVINGVLLNDADNGHAAAIKYMSTGNGQGKLPDFPMSLDLVESSSMLGTLASSTLYRSESSGLSTFTNDLLLSLKKTPTFSGVNYMKQSTDLSEALKNWLWSSSKMSSINTAFNEIKKNNLAQNLLDTTLQVTAAALKVDAARFAILDVGLDLELDTHSSHVEAHLQRQKIFWSRVASTFKLFKSIPNLNETQSLFDETLFLVISEFGRTPFLNGANGKDHNPLLNSVVFASGSLQGGKTFGASTLIPHAQSGRESSIHMACPFDFELCEPTRSPERASFIFPENIYATAATILGIPLQKIHGFNPATKMISGIKI